MLTKPEAQMIHDAFSKATPEEVALIVAEFRKSGILAAASHVDDGKDDVIIRIQGKVLVVIHPDGTHTVPDADC